jgi:hypothetical protein
MPIKTRTAQIWELCAQSWRFPSRAGLRAAESTDGQAKAGSWVRVRPAGGWLWCPQRRLGSRLGSASGAG